MTLAKLSCRRAWTQAVFWAAVMHEHAVVLNMMEAILSQG